MIIINYPLIQTPINLLIKAHDGYISIIRCRFMPRSCYSVVCVVHINYTENSIKMIDTDGGVGGGGGSGGQWRAQTDYYSSVALIQLSTCSTVTTFWVVYSGSYSYTTCFQGISSISRLGRAARRERLYADSLRTLYGQRTWLIYGHYCYSIKV